MPSPSRGSSPGLDCLLIPTGYLLPCPRSDADSQVAVVHLSPCKLPPQSLPGQGRGHFFLHLPHSTGLPRVPLPPAQNSRPAIAFPALSPIPGFRDACVTMCTAIHVEGNVPVWWAALKESYFSKWTRWWWWWGIKEQRIPASKYSQNAPKHDKVLPPDQKQ